MNSHDRIGVGLLGYGLAGSTFHAPVIAAVPALELRAVMTSRRDDVARDLPGVAIVDDIAAICDDPRIALVVVATPNTSHAALAERALRAGKHVVIDKPMTTTSAEADALIALAAQRERILAVYHNRRWDGDFLTVREQVAGGALGRIFTYEAHYDRFRIEIKPGWRSDVLPGSGTLFDLGSHLIDQALALLGWPDTVWADAIAQRVGERVDDYVHIVLGYGRTRAILHAGTIVALPGPRFAVHGDRGSFVKHGTDPQEAALKARTAVGGAGWGADDPAQYGTLQHAGGEREMIPTLPGQYQAFYAGMAAAIGGGAPPPVSGTDGRNVIRIIELARESARVGAVLPSSPAAGLVGELAD